LSSKLEQEQTKAEEEVAQTRLDMIQPPQQQQQQTWKPQQLDDNEQLLAQLYQPPDPQPQQQPMYNSQPFPLQQQQPPQFDPQQQQQQQEQQQQQQQQSLDWNDMPPALHIYAQNLFKLCTNREDIEKARAYLQYLILNSAQQSNLWTTDWSTFPLPTEILSQPQQQNNMYNQQQQVPPRLQQQQQKVISYINLKSCLVLMQQQNKHTENK